MNTAFVLAAGLGTRLRPLTDHRPKPLVPVCGVPLLAYSLALCQKYGLTDVIVNAHHLAPQIEAWAGEREGVRVTVSTELPEILGTGGGLKRVQGLLAERFVILNGDVLQDVDLRALLEQVPDGGGALVLRPNAEDAEKYGHVSADATGTVVRMREFAAAAPQGEVAGDTHFTGIHAMHRGLLDDAEAGFSCILRTAYTRRIGRRLVRGVRYAGPWLDIGDPEGYLATNLAVLRGELRFALDPFARAGSVPDGVQVRGRAWVGPGARIAPGAVLEDAVIGAGATVGPVHVRRSVVWDGVTVDGDLDGAVAHDGGVLQVSGRTDPG